MNSKRILAFFLSLCIMFALIGCGGSTATNEKTNNTAESDNNQTTATKAPTPTKEPTPIPTEAPTPEPTATPEPTPDPVAWTVIGSGVDQYVNSINTKYVRVWVLVENSGSAPLYLSSCDIDIEDTSGNLIQTVKSVSAFPQVLLPGERGVYEEDTFAADGLPANGLTVYSRLKITEAKVDCLRLDVTNVEIYEDRYSGTKVRGRVINNTAEDATGFIYAAVLCYDKDSNFLGTLWTIITDEIPAGERQGFESMGSDWIKSAKDVAYFDAYAYPQQYQW